MTTRRKPGVGEGLSGVSACMRPLGFEEVRAGNVPPGWLYLIGGTIMPIRTEGVPGTIRRSPEKVRRTYRETLDSAHEQYRSEERAHRAAWASVKHVAEKVGDHWELKDVQGPSDDQDAQR